MLAGGTLPEASSQRGGCVGRDAGAAAAELYLCGNELFAPSLPRGLEAQATQLQATLRGAVQHFRAQNLRKNALTPPPLTRFRWHEPVLAHVGSRRRTVLGARRPRQVQDRKVFGCE